MGDESVDHVDSRVCEGHHAKLPRRASVTTVLLAQQEPMPASANDIALGRGRVAQHVILNDSTQLYLAIFGRMARKKRFANFLLRIGL